MGNYDCFGTEAPTQSPTNSPSVDPTINPTQDPTLEPTLNPTINPTANPSLSPTLKPTRFPTKLNQYNSYFPITYSMVNCSQSDKIKIMENAIEITHSLAEIIEFGYVETYPLLSYYSFWLRIKSMNDVKISRIATLSPLDKTQRFLNSDSIFLDAEIRCDEDECVYLKSIDQRIEFEDSVEQKLKIFFTNSPQISFKVSDDSSAIKSLISTNEVVIDYVFWSLTSLTFAL